MIYDIFQWACNNILPGHIFLGAIVAFIIWRIAFGGPIDHDDYGAW